MEDSTLVELPCGMAVRMISKRQKYERIALNTWHLYTYVGLQLAPNDNNTLYNTKITKLKQNTHTHTIYIKCGKGNMWSHRLWVRNMYLILPTCTFYQCELVSIGSVSTLNVIKHFILAAAALTQKGCTWLCCTYLCTILGQSTY